MKYQLNPQVSRRDYAAELNEQQYAAVTTNARHALVIAGAGSGKTRTLTYRVSWLVEHGVAPWRILLLTFTNKAAKEMLKRVSDLAALDTSSIWGGTFHSVANRMLRRNPERLGYSANFSILDSDDQNALMKAIYKQHAPKDAASPAKNKGRAKGKIFPKPKMLLSLHSLAASTGEPWQQVLIERYPEWEEYEEAITTIYQEYATRKKAANAMDFDDLLTHAVALLEENKDLREHYQNRFEHVLVDEYQDTNSPQDRFIALMAGGAHSCLMAVGDDAQSIYSWRGASVEHIFQFEQLYPDAQIFKIEINYRSVPAILELSNAAIAMNTRQFAKELKSHRPSGGLRPALVPVADTRMEARFVAQRI
ncbi:MAG: ATP-dependent helicase, partial [Akkermansia sp.]